MPSTVLDVLPGAMGGWSLRKLRTAYAGPCCNIRRSIDNVTQDIGFVGSDFDVASFNTFVGAGQGFVAIWYDQSGNTGRNGVQGIAAKQPQLVTSVAGFGGKPGILFAENSTQCFSTTVSTMVGLFTGPNPAMVSTVCNIAVPTTGNDRIWTLAGGPAPTAGPTLFVGSDTQIISAWTGQAAARWSASRQLALGAYTLDATTRWVAPTDTGQLWINGQSVRIFTTSPPLGAPGPETGQTFFIGGANANGGFPGHIAEMICWQSSPNVATLHASQQPYWGTP